jgi:hypothetical protein
VALYSNQTKGIFAVQILYFALFVGNRPHQNIIKEQTMSKEKQIDIIRDLLVEFDEMGFIPTTTVPHPEAYAIKWRAEITKALTDYFKQTEWISVDERLPENDYGKHWKERQYYLVMTEPTGLMRVARYGYKEYGWWVDGHSCVLDERNYKRVTHWMPLPEAPKMKGGAE